MQVVLMRELLVSEIMGVRDAFFTGSAFLSLFVVLIPERLPTLRVCYPILVIF